MPKGECRSAPLWAFVRIFVSCYFFQKNRSQKDTAIPPLRYNPKESNSQRPLLPQAALFPAPQFFLFCNAAVLQ